MCLLLNFIPLKYHGQCPLPYVNKNMIYYHTPQIYYQISHKYTRYDSNKNYIKYFCTLNFCITLSNYHYLEFNSTTEYIIRKSE